MKRMFWQCFTFCNLNSAFSIFLYIENRRFGSGFGELEVLAGPLGVPALLSLVFAEEGRGKLARVRKAP